MEGLKLGQKIIVDSTNYFDGELLDMCSTSIADAYDQGSGIRIKMANDHNWGACPSRPIENIIKDKNDIDRFFDMRVKRNKNLDKIKEGLEKGTITLQVTRTMNNCLKVKVFRKVNEVKSLKDGNYTEFRSSCGGGYESIKVRSGNIPHDFARSLDEAKEKFNRLAKAFL